jgi:hypothetical protein
VKAKIRRQLAHRKRRIQRRLDKANVDGCRRPVFTASYIRYEIADRTRAVGSGGIGALARRVGLIDGIDRRLHLLQFHFPYHESDHVPGRLHFRSAWISRSCDSGRTEKRLFFGTRLT